ncbi:MAG TPA: hypothetical protein VFD66_11590 [Verrucomicrobiae bacterium]|nr:hypothetical protein [Verrucomicrobiae bacterium]
MKRTSSLITGVIIGTFAAAFLPHVASAQPSGTITTNVSSPTDLVWDVGTVITRISFGVTFPGSTTVNISYPVVVSQSGAGVISGGAPKPAATLTVLGASFPFSGGKSKVTGTISSNNGKGRALIRTTVSGSVSGVETRRVNATHNLIVRFDNTARTTTGTETDMVTIHPPIRTGEAVGHGSVPINEAPSAFFAGNGNGSWTLTLSGITSLDNKVLGSATVVLNSGRSFNYTVHGSFSSSTGNSKLTLTAGDKSTRDSTLHVVLDGNVITSIRGVISGQSVNASF